MNPKRTNSDNTHNDHMQIVNMNARMYDPLMGQFISVDPLADKYPGWGPYVYCMNNPLIYIDPTGEEGDEVEDALKDEEEELKDELANFNLLENVLDGIINTVDALTETVGELVEGATEVVMEKGFGETLSKTGDVAGLVELATETANAPNLSSAANKVGLAASAGSILIEASNTDFSNSEEVAEFTKNTAKTAVKSTPAGLVIGTSVEVIIKDAKKSDGLTNLDNGRMSGAFKANYNQIQSGNYFLQQARAREASKKK